METASVVNLSDKRIDKWAVEVQLDLDDGTRMLGSLFVMPQQQRVSDLLSDERQFLPFRGSDGLTYMLRKSRISRVVEVSQEAQETDEVGDPYDLLGVSRGISDEELKRTYHNLCGETHPDRMRSMDLPHDMIAMAHARTVRIIDAYDRIVKERQRLHGANGRNGANGANGTNGTNGHDAGAD